MDLGGGPVVASGLEIPLTAMWVLFAKFKSIAVYQAPKTHTEKKNLKSLVGLVIRKTILTTLCLSKTCRIWVQE